MRYNGAILSKLDDTERQFVLAHYNGMTYAQIAAATEQTVDQVKQIFESARRKCNATSIGHLIDMIEMPDDTLTEEGREIMRRVTERARTWRPDKPIRK